MRKPPTHPALAQAIIDAGSRANLARICGCRRQNIQRLEKLGKPLSPKFVPAAAKALGRTYHDLNPDVYPKEGR